MIDDCDWCSPVGSSEISSSAVGVVFRLLSSSSSSSSSSFLKINDTAMAIAITCNTIRHWGVWLGKATLYKVWRLWNNKWWWPDDIGCDVSTKIMLCSIRKPTTTDQPYLHSGFQSKWNQLTQLCQPDVAIQRNSLCLILPRILKQLWLYIILLLISYGSSSGISMGPHISVLLVCLCVAGLGSGGWGGGWGWVSGGISLLLMSNGFKCRSPCYRGDMGPHVVSVYYWWQWVPRWYIF